MAMIFLLGAQSLICFKLCSKAVGSITILVGRDNLLYPLIPTKCQIFKAGIFTKKGNPCFTYRTVTLLCNNNFCCAFIRAMLIINFIAVNKTNQIRVLLNRSRFT